MWHDIFQAYADTISVATMQRPQVSETGRERPETWSEPEESHPRRSAGAYAIAQWIATRIRETRQPVVAGCG